jgi:hypothetical protein
MAHHIRKTKYFSSNSNAEVGNTVVIGVQACMQVCVCVCVHARACVEVKCSLKQWKRKEVLTTQRDVFPYDYVS